MLKTFSLLLAVSTLSLGARAQTTDGSSPSPIVRSRPGQIVSTQPMPGVWVRSDASGAVKTVSASKDAAEIRVEHGRATIEVHHPAPNSMITVDLPGGQADLIKDGVYTFNAETNTVRVLNGEADGYAGSASSGKRVKIKEDHQLSFAAGANLKATEASPQEIASDVVANPGAERGYAGRGYGAGYAPGYGYAPGPYGDGYGDYPYPSYAYGYGYPYGFYPYYGFGLGFGYFGGFRGGYGRFGRR